MATILRQHEAESSTDRSLHKVAFNFEDMNDRANEYLETVRREAAKIVQEAHQQSEQIRRQAEKAGLADAEAAAQRAFDEKMGRQLETIFPAIEKLVAELNETKANWLRHWEQSAVGTAAKIAERLVRHELQHRPEITLDWISEALRLAAGGSEMILRLNPQDYENLGNQVAKIAQSLCQLAPANIVPDPEVSPGGCVIDTRFGQIDQRIEAQLARIQEELK